MMQQNQQHTNQWILTPKQLNRVSFIFVTHLIRGELIQNLFFHTFLHVSQVPKISKVYQISQVSEILRLSRVFQLSQRTLHI